MRAGTMESFVFYLALLITSIVIWIIILRFFRIKGMSIAFGLGYLTLVAFAMIKGWQPLDPLGFTKQASEVVSFSWPAILIEQQLKLKSGLAYVLIAAATLQYIILGWIVDLLMGSVFGRDR